MAKENTGRVIVQAISSVEGADLVYIQSTGHRTLDMFRKPSK